MLSIPLFSAGYRVAMKQELAIGVLESRRDAKLKQIAEAGPMIQGSLATIRVTCGKQT
jgi:hypothetical protein